jgi:endonuclease-8
VYRVGERWKMPAHAARIVLTTDAWVAVCFRAPVVSLLAAGDERRTPALASLGPDLAREDFDAPRAVARLRALAELAIGEAVMRQDALAGIGNVYKSEVLFVTRVDPFVRVATLDGATLARIVATAHELLRRNLDGRGRVTTSRALAATSHVWVYGRSGRPCFECGTTLAMRRQGTLGRSTYYCAKCQGVTLVRARSSGSPRRRDRP